MKHLLPILLLPTLLTGCPSVSGTGLDDSAGPGEVPVQTPILERTVQAGLRCTLEGETLELSAVTAIGGAYFHAKATEDALRVAWVAQTSEGLELRQGELAEDGRLVDEQFLAEGQGSPSVPGIATGALAWMEDVESRRSLHLRLDATSTAVEASIPSSSDPLVRLETLGEGWLAVWGSDEGLHARWLDAAGQEVRTEVVDGGWVSDPKVAATSSGVALTWAVSVDGGSACRIATVDSEGLTLEPATVSPAGVRCRYPTVIARDDDLLTAWSESGDDHATVQLAAVQSDGNITARIPLAAAEPEVLREIPALAMLGDALLLVWSEGSWEEWCSGCIPDHQLRWLTLDAATLDPLSTIDGATSPNGGGMHRARILPSSAGAVLAYDTTFHGWNEAGSAALGCE